MKKTVGVLSGLVVAVAVASTAGAWYTGKQLPEVLDQAIAQSNAQIKQSLTGMGSSVTLDLVSLERHLYSSTAHYRVKVKDLMVGDERQSLELSFVDRIEHGPLPWTRLKALKLMPVMAASNYSLEKDALTSQWFAASGDVAPLQGQTAIGYDGSTESSFNMAPLDLTQADGSVVKFSGFEIEARGTKDAEQVKFSGHSGELNMNLVDADRAPLKLAFKGLNLQGELSKTPYGFYVGPTNMGLDELSVAMGGEQKVLLMKRLEQNSMSKADGASFSGNIVYKVGDITFDGKPVGSSEVLFSMKNLDIPAMLALADWYQSRLPEFQAAAAKGQALPSLPMTEAEKALVNTNVQQLLASKPQFALENVSFKTANGESRFNLSVDLTNPSSLDLPEGELARQMIAQVQSKLHLSKPMIGDLAVLQASLEGQSDAQVLAQQAAQAGEMVGMLALQSQMATVQGSDIVASLHYADGKVDFNGQKMTVEQFASLIMANLGAMRPTEG